MSIFLDKFPFNEAIVIMKGTDAGKCTDELSKWSESVDRQVSASPVAPEPATQLGAPPGAPVTASTSGTLGGSIPAGVYAIYAYREVVVADPVSSSFGITLTWTHNGKALQRILPPFSGAPQTTNNTSGDATVIEIDPNTSIGYSLTYASNTPALAGFQVTLIANLLQTLS